MMSKRVKLVIGVCVVVFTMIGAGCTDIGMVGSVATSTPDTPSTTSSVSGASTTQVVAVKDVREAALNLPRGFSLNVFAKGLSNPRVMVTDPNGVLLVSVQSRGEILALPDTDHDGHADKAVVVVKGLRMPHGLAFRCVGQSCTLYVAETDVVVSYEYHPDSMTVSGRHKLADLPSAGFHATRSLQFLPAPNDSTLLVAVGSSCNVCNETDARRAAILSLNVESGEMAELKPYATGLRNSVFQAINPKTNQVWATEMGRDWLGDNTPPDEVNILEEGKDYGWPVCYGKNVHDTSFDTSKANPCVEPGKVPSHIDIPAHSAPLGLSFSPSDWPSGYAENLFIAYHGSWNRTVPTGDKVVRVILDADGKAQKVEDFLTGWKSALGTFSGRPAGLLTTSRGELFVADDKAGVIYRITPSGD